MTPEIVVGLIGAGGALSGALIGGIATFSGVVYQQKRQSKQAADERRIEMAHQSVDIILTELDGVRGLADERPEHKGGTPEEVAAWSPEVRAWNNKLSKHLGNIGQALLRLPDEELRKDLEAVCFAGFGNESWLSEVTSAPSGRAIMYATTAEAQRCLGAYLRGEPIPPTRYMRQARQAFVELVGYDPS